MWRPFGSPRSLFGKNRANLGLEIDRSDAGRSSRSTGRGTLNLLGHQGGWVASARWTPSPRPDPDQQRAFCEAASRGVDSIDGYGFRS